MTQETLSEQIRREQREADFEAARRGWRESAKLGDEEEVQKRILQINEEQRQAEAAAAGRIAVEGPSNPR